MLNKSKPGLQEPGQPVGHQLFGRMQRNSKVSLDFEAFTLTAPPSCRILLRLSGSFTCFKVLVVRCCDDSS